MKGFVVSVSVNPKNIIVTSDGSRYQKADKGKVIAGVFVANMAGGTVLQTTKYLSQIPLSMAKKDVVVFSASELPRMIDSALHKSGLADKGLKIIDATEANAGLIKEAFDTALPKWMNKVPKLKEIIVSKLNAKANIVKEGKNAFFIPRANTIVINKEKMGWAAFHEMGHALNNQSKGVIAVLNKIKGPAVLLASIALFTAFFKRKKVDGEKPQGAWDKATTFVKNNCGKLAFLGFVPTLLEEGLASIRGAKLAKGIVSPEQLKVLNKLHGKAWLTYLGTAVGTALAAYTVSKVRDHFTTPKKIS